jgi:hypothetical protein
MDNKLSADFMAELFKLIYLDSNIIRIACNYLTYQLIPKEWPGYKVLLREAIEIFSTKEIVPSLGVVAQKYKDNDYVQEAIEAVKNAAKVDKELIIDQLESYIKDTEFQILSKKVHDLYEDGKKEEAIRTNAEESKRILDISLRHDGGGFIQVFRGFKERMKDKRRNSVEEGNDKITFGIDRLDEISYGGASIEDTCLWIMRSGIGKSTALRHHGMAAVLEGWPVLHIQLEGGVRACVDKYDQYWTNQSYNDIRKGFLKPEDEEKVMETYRNMSSLGEDISIYGFEKFGEASMVDVRNLILDYHKVHGYYPKLLILDSLDLVSTGINNQIDNNPNYKKEKLQTCSQLFKNLCVEFKMVGITAAQAGNVPMEIWDNPDKVIDRSFTEGDRTLVKPYSFVFTGNITSEEKKLNQCRIFIDKLRDYKQASETFRIITDYNRGRFYNKKRTLEVYKGNDDMVSNTPAPMKKEKLKKAERI